jgi:hypothetical protein
VYLGQALLLVLLLFTKEKKGLKEGGRRGTQGYQGQLYRITFFSSPLQLPFEIQLSLSLFLYLTISGSLLGILRLVDLMVNKTLVVHDKVRKRRDNSGMNHSGDQSSDTSVTGSEMCKHKCVTHQTHSFTFD